METRTCKKCKLEKNISAFGKTKINGIIYHKYTCSNCQSKAWRLKNPHKAKKIQCRARLKYKSKHQQYKVALLSHIGQNCCLECGFSQVEALHFHHRNPDEKTFNIKFGFTHSYSLETLKIEAKKCNVLCANCHILHHYKGTNKRRDNIKKLLLEAVGQTKCSKCGYSNTQTLSFHHNGNKQFGLGKKLHWLPFEDLVKEAKKCTILCANCHSLAHFQF